MQILGLVRSQDHVCARYRLHAFRPQLEALGHQLEVRTWSDGWWSRRPLLRAVRSADVVVIQRRLLGLDAFRSVRAAARKLAFDFDDAVFCRDSYDPRGPSCPERLRRFVRTVRGADLVFAGNAFLAEQAGCWTNPDKVRVLPPASIPVVMHRRRTGKVRQIAPVPRRCPGRSSWYGSGHRARCVAWRI